MVYVTGDKHRSFKDVEYFCSRVETTKDDLLIILGDAGINFLGDYYDSEVKARLERLPIRLLCVHGNHEKRPHTIESYTEVPFLGGVVYQEAKFPSILFAKDGEVYDFGGKKAVVIGGAYSPDKPRRLTMGMGWWEDEQPSVEIKDRVESVLTDLDYKVDYVLSHTCPDRYVPKEMFLPGIDQKTVDKSTEEWLGVLESKLSYENWYCGHWHTSKKVDNFTFMYDDYRVLGK